VPVLRGLPCQCPGCNYASAPGVTMPVPQGLLCQWPGCNYAGAPGVTMPVPRGLLCQCSGCNYASAPDVTMPVPLLPYLAILPKPAKYIYNLLPPYKRQSRQSRQSIQYQQTLQTPIFFFIQPSLILLRHTKSQRWCSE
jgi:hypothetical protein